MRRWWLSVLLLASVPARAGAVRDAERAVLEDPTSVEVWVMLGDTYRKAGRKTDAMEAWQRGLALQPDSEEIRARIAELGPRGKASKLERKALRNPLDDELWGDLGDEYALMGQRDSALRSYLYAFQLDPSDSEWQRKVTELGGLDQILETVEAQSASLTDDERLGDFGDLMQQAGRMEEACALWARAAEADPSDSEWPGKLVECGGGYEVYPTPIEGGEPAPYGISGGGDSGLTALARSALVSGDKARALEYFQAAVLDDPSDKEALTGVMVLTGKTLVDVLGTLTTRIPNSDELWGDLGDACVAVGDLDGARKAYARAAELDPSDTEWGRKRAILDPDSGLAVPASPSDRVPLFQLPDPR